MYRRVYLEHVGRPNKYKAVKPSEFDPGLLQGEWLGFLHQFFTAVFGGQEGGLSHATIKVYAATIMTGLTTYISLVTW